MRTVHEKKRRYSASNRRMVTKEICALVTFTSGSAVLFGDTKVRHARARLTRGPSVWSIVEIHEICLQVFVVTPQKNNGFGAVEKCQKCWNVVVETDYA